MRGFTLIETLVYMEIFTLMLTGLLGGFIALRDLSSRATTLALLYDTDTFIDSTLESLLQGLPADMTVFGTTSTLMLDTANNENAFAKDGVLIHQINGNVMDISDTDVRVENFTAVGIAGSSSTPPTIKVMYTLGAASANGGYIRKILTHSYYALP